MNLLIAHLVGDYLFQNRWMALNKYKATWICMLHAFIYGFSIMFICGWYYWEFWVVVITHYVIDRYRIGAK